MVDLTELQTPPSSLMAPARYSQHLEGDSGEDELDWGPGPPSITRHSPPPISPPWLCPPSQLSPQCSLSPSPSRSTTPAITPATRQVQKRQAKRDFNEIFKQRLEDREDAKAKRHKVEMELKKEDIENNRKRGVEQMFWYNEGAKEEIAVKREKIQSQERMVRLQTEAIVQQSNAQSRQAEGFERIMERLLGIIAGNAGASNAGGSNAGGSNAGAGDAGAGHS